MAVLRRESVKWEDSGRLWTDALVEPLGIVRSHVSSFIEVDWGRYNHRRVPTPVQLFDHGRSKAKHQSPNALPAAIQEPLCRTIRPWRGASGAPGISNMSPSQSSHAPCESETLQSLTFPLTKKPKYCWAREHMAPVRIERRTWISSEGVCSMVRPYYICTTCDNGKFNVFRDSGYPRGFITWGDSIGIHPQKPRCYCGFPSRQDCALREPVTTS